ncbi:MAG: hypothetical protein M0P31_00620 [Solirubrobacteraceae bacterium]|nr:hypothetical protein [Solirubrobacteraceae bacterium]
MRSPVRWLLAVVAVGVVAAVLALTLRTTPDAFSFNAPPSAVAVELAPGEEACQGPIRVPRGGAFSTVRVPLSTPGRPGPRLDATVRVGDRVVARGGVDAGYLDGGDPPITLDRTVSAARVTLCLRNAGDVGMGIYGTAGAAVQYSRVHVGGQEHEVDLALRFERSERSLASAVPDVVRRMALFRAVRVPGGAYAIGIVLLVVAGVGALAVALRRLED